MNVKAGIKISGLHSYTAYGLTLVDRDIGLPQRQTNFVEIPYMNGYYDMANIVEPYYSSRTLKYTFDLMADDEIAVEALKNDVYTWAKTAVESDIYDDDDPNYHFVGSFTKMTYSPDDELPEFGGQVVLEFTAQPYRYENDSGEGTI